MSDQKAALDRKVERPIAYALIFGVCVIVILAVAKFYGYSASDPKPTSEPATTAQGAFTQENLDYAQMVIRARGFDCTKPIQMRDMLFGGGFVVKCEGRSPNTLYWFNIEDQGGKWIVKAKGFGD